jgi:hypothetical protein
VIGSTVVSLVIVSDAQATAVQASSMDTLSDVVDHEVMHARVRHRRFEGGECDVKLVDFRGAAQPWDVELGLLGYPPGKVLYLRECVR